MAHYILSCWILGYCCPPTHAHNCTLHSELLTADHCAFPDRRAWSHARTTRRSAALTQTWHFELISSFSPLPKPCKTIFTILGWTSIILNPSTQIKQFFVASPCSEKPPVQWSLIFHAPWPSWPLQYENNNWHPTSPLPQFTGYTSSASTSMHSCKWLHLVFTNPGFT